MTPKFASLRFWESLSAGEKIALLTLITGLIAVVCAALVVPEFRMALGLPAAPESHSPAPIIETKTTAPRTQESQPWDKFLQETPGGLVNPATPVEQNKRVGLDEAGVGSRSSRPTQNENRLSVAPSSEPKGERSSIPRFEGDSYRIRVESLRKVDRSAVLVLDVEGLENQTVNVRICGWYMLDENAERWDEEGEDTAGICDGAGGGVDVRDGIKITTKLVFRPKEASSGTRFSIMGSRLPDPSQPGGKVVITGVTSD